MNCYTPYFSVFILLTFLKLNGGAWLYTSEYYSLAAGPYYFTARDGNSCTASGSANIEPQPGICIFLIYLFL